MNTTVSAPPVSPERAALVAAIVPHVVFDGWSHTAWDAAVAELGLTQQQALAAAPRGVMDLAVAYHHLGDAAMLEKIAAADWSALRYSDKVAAAIWLRLEGADREVVRRGTTFFALPQHAPEGATLIWGTADLIWRALGDKSDDVNWYSKRAILSGVYGSTVLFWLGDDTGGEATRDYIDRRIADVMRFEKFKAGVRENQTLRPLVAGLDRLFGGIRAPRQARRDDLPGHWSPTDGDGA